MIPVRIQTLIVASAPSPSIIVLQPIENEESTKGVRVVPIWIGINEATQMGIALEKARFVRPMTHDLFLDALTNLDATIDHVFIHDVNDTTFYAKLVLRQHNRLLELDARPSDALALAVRQEAPMFIAEDVLEKSSFVYAFNKSPVAEEEIEAFHEFIEGLAPEDFEA
ncbi:MAG: bifunctional nuclease family protein [Raoultibacter sp.]|jgi:bifunctional DNase/RNase